MLLMYRIYNFIDFPSHLWCLENVSQKIRPSRLAADAPLTFGLSVRRRPFDGHGILPSQCQQPTPLGRTLTGR